MQVIEFMYDFGSPNSYLAHKVLPDIARRTGAELRYVPILLGGVFKATHNQSPMQAYGDVTGKLAYQHHEIERFVARRQIHYHMNPYFPIMTISLMRGAMFALEKPWESEYIEAVFNAVWVHGQKLDELNVFTGVLDEAGLQSEEITRAIRTPDIKQALIENTQRAVERGVFGAPTMFVGTEMFFGKDSLPDLEFVLSNLD